MGSGIQESTQLENYSKNVHQTMANTLNARALVVNDVDAVSGHGLLFSIPHNSLTIESMSLFILINLHEVEHVFKRTESHIIRLEISFLAFDPWHFLWVCVCVVCVY